MSVQGVADKVAEVLKAGKHDFVMCNFAPPDMVSSFSSSSSFLPSELMYLSKVGHTGVYDAAVEAITKTDLAVGTVYEAAKSAGYILLITADHGNAEQMINAETGAPHTAHTTNPVPFIMTADKDEWTFAEDKVGDKNEVGEEEGALCDVASTVLALMGLEIPEGT
jgi:2,3-bisphosphoglycerate-independent phosphoglycerate mutase